MKFNISYPITGQQKTFDIDDEKRVSIFYDKRMGAEVVGDNLGEEFKGYIFKVTGGQDRDGFPMKQGIMVKGRVRILLEDIKDQKCYRPHRSGARQRKSVRGCIVGGDINVLALSIVKKGDKDIEGLTSASIPRRLGPKRANKIRKLYKLEKTDDVRRYVVRRNITKEGKKQRQKAPRIQRLITAERLRRKRVYRSERLAKVKRNQAALAAYVALKKAAKKKTAAAAAPAQAAAPAKTDAKAPAKTAAPAGKTAAAPAKGAQPAKTAAPAPAAAKKEAPKAAAPAPAAKGGKK